jgi:hypothetical protein
MLKWDINLTGCAWADKEWSWTLLGYSNNIEYNLII